MRAARPRGERAELRALEGLILRLRTGALLFAAAQTAFDPGDSVGLSWALVGVLALTCAGAWGTLRHRPGVAALKALGAVTLGLDSLVVAGTLFNNLSVHTPGMYLLGLLPVLAAGARYGLVGGVVSGLGAGLLMAVFARERAEELELAASPGGGTFLVGITVLLGSVFGALVSEMRRERNALTQTLEASQDLLLTLDPDGRVVSANPAAETLLGGGPDTLLGRRYEELLEDPTTAGDDLQRWRSGGAELVLQRFATPGEAVPVEVSASYSPDGELVYVAGRNVTERERDQAALAESEQRYRSLFDQNSDAVFALDQDAVFVAANGPGIALLGIAPEELLGRSLWELPGSNLANWDREHFQEVLQGRHVTQELTVEQGGEERSLAVKNIPVVVNGVVVGVYAVVRDVTEQHQAERTLSRQAWYDPLTGLPNRASVLDALEGELVKQRLGGEPVGVLFVDLDRVNLVNDSLGHGAGDQLLRISGNRIQRTLRPGDHAGRFAGDEFVVVVTRCTSPEVATGVARRVLAALGEPLELEGQEVFGGASVGVAISTGSESGDVLLRMADEALYDAKRRGRSQYALHDPARGPRRGGQLALESELRHALEQDELVPYFQPVVDLSTGEIRGVEALVRWHHPERGVLVPSGFVPAAEETELVTLITDRMLDEVCSHLSRWDQHGLPQLTAAVNLSGRDFSRRDLADQVSVALARHGVDPSRLVLEVTESVLMQDPDQALDTLSTLRGRGVRLAIDDFGTGYASLSYLRHFPVHAVKVDRSFVSGLGGHQEASRKDRAIVGSVLSLASGLGLSAVAEGVETRAQAELLQELGCDLAQGYLYSRPLSAEAFERLASRRVALPE